MQCRHLVVRQTLRHQPTKPHSCDRKQGNYYLMTSLHDATFQDIEVIAFRKQIQLVTSCCNLAGSTVDRSAPFPHHSSTPPPKKNKSFIRANNNPCPDKPSAFRNGRWSPSLSLELWTRLDFSKFPEHLLDFEF